MRKRTTCLRFKMVERCQMNQATLRSKWMSFQLQGRWARVSLRCLHWKIAAEVATRGCAVEAAVEVRKTIPNCLNSVHSWVILYTYKKGWCTMTPWSWDGFLLGLLYAIGGMNIAILVLTNFGTWVLTNQMGLWSNIDAKWVDCCSIFLGLRMDHFS